MSGITVAKATQGFLSAGARPSCRNCQLVAYEFTDRAPPAQKFANQAPPFEEASWYCKKGQFYTSAMAICNDHQPTTSHAQRQQACGNAPTTPEAV